MATHAVLLKSNGFTDYRRTIEIPKSSKLTRKAQFQAQSPPGPRRLLVVSLTS